MVVLPAMALVIPVVRVVIMDVKEHVIQDATEGAM